MSVRDDFLAFCETVCKRPLTAQQRALAEALVANSREFVQKLHKRFMQGRRADLLIVDDVTDERPR